jgi:predicted ribonuclease YlaK
MGNKYGSLEFKWLADKGVNPLNDRHTYALAQALFQDVGMVQACFVEGQAGTGKSTLSVLSGIFQLEKGLYEKVMYIKNAETIGKELGYMPGGEEKMLIHQRPFLEACDMVQPGYYEKDKESKFPRLEATTPTFIRGTNIKNTFLILDEVQSMSLQELQAILTRVHESTKVVILYSVKQVDGRDKRIKGKLPVEWYAQHFEGFPVTFHTLHKVYRGAFAQHSDLILDTIDG